MADVLILVALIESDSGPDGALMVQNAAQASMAGNVLALKSAGLSRHDLSQKLIENLYGAISLGARPGGIAFYDACLGVGEFSLAQRSQDGSRHTAPGGTRARAGREIAASAGGTAQS